MGWKHTKLRRTMEILNVRQSKGRPLKIALIHLESERLNAGFQESNPETNAVFL